MTAPDPRALARQLGPEQMEALVDTILDELDYPGTSGGPRTRFQFGQAARSLAAPVEPEPQWPTEELWAWFEPDGRFMRVSKLEPIEVYNGCFRLPARVVPADAVVLTAEQASEALQHVCGSPQKVTNALFDALRGEAT